MLVPHEQAGIHVFREAERAMLLNLGLGDGGSGEICVLREVGKPGDL